MLGAVAHEAAERFGDDTAYVGPDGRTLSYRELDAAADEVAVGLLERGITEGDVVALALPTAFEHVVAYIGAARIGAITAGVNTRLAAPEQARVLDLAQPAIILREVGDVAGLRVRGAAPPPLADDPDRPVAIVFTSGTTGTPKGAVFGSRQLAFITEVDTGGLWGGGGPTFAATSFAHLGPTTKLPGTLMRGGVTHLLERWQAADAIRMVAEHRMAGIGGIPTQIALMLADPSRADHDLSCLRAIVMGGGPATPALVRAARAELGAAVSIRYSCTEAGIGIGTAFDAPPEDAEVSVGRPHAGVELALRQVDDPDRPAGTGQVGEVCLRSPAAMDRYWRAPDATAEAFTPDGYVRTGDLGWLDPERRLRLVGRSKEMYVRGGYNVYPMEVEGVLATHPSVAEVAVVPRADDVMGEVGVAVVVLRPGAASVTAEDLRSLAHDELAAYKLPAEVRIVDELPLTAMEKVDRRALRAMIETR